MIIEVSSEIKQTARVLQVSGLFDVPPSERSINRWDVQMPLTERPWNVGLIVGPSGCGKSTIASRMWPAEFSATFSWNHATSLLDDFPKALAIKEIVAILSSVGFSSPPDWLKPFHVLSNGQKFRVEMARRLAEAGSVSSAEASGAGTCSPIVVDEFTSVVDRTVAQIGAHAVAKQIRRAGQQLVAVSCHEDVEEWLQPDWVYRPAEQRFTWRLLQRRPAITLEINRVHHSTWELFHRYHYLDASLNRSAICFGAFWKGKIVAFDSWLPFVGKLKNDTKAKRSHRVVCLPDYQGVGIGQIVNTRLAAMWKALGYRAFLATSHPGFIASRAHDRAWRLTRAPSRTAADTGKQQSMAASRAINRLTASFEYQGPAIDRALASETLNTWAKMA